MTTSTRQLPKNATLRLDLARSVTPRALAELPRHRWFFFPHSYDPTLVSEVFEHWGLQPGDAVLDPFVGAGTTLVAARSRALRATGLDLSPLAVLASAVKSGDYRADTLESALVAVVAEARADPVTPVVGPPLRLLRAFSRSELSRIIALRAAILRRRSPVREFLLLALLSTAREFSRAVADGGWFRWVQRTSQAGRILPAFEQRARLMIADVRSTNHHRPAQIQVQIGDARRMDHRRRFDAVITSPPYPNRHDYSRVFHVELLLMGIEESNITWLRHHSLRSHVEARRSGPRPALYRPPQVVTEVLRSLPPSLDKRVAGMLDGYFEDLFFTLSEVAAVLRPGGHAAFVVGNVRHGGVLVPVDEALVAVARTTGFRHETTWVARERGNSAQQMGRFGREPARESVVLLEK